MNGTSFSPDSVYQAPCASCASLFPRIEITIHPCYEVNLLPLERVGDGITRVERRLPIDPVGGRARVAGITLRRVSRNVINKMSLGVQLVAELTTVIRRASKLWR